MFGLGTPEILALLLLPVVCGLLVLPVILAYRHGKKIGRLEEQARSSGTRPPSGGSTPPTFPTSGH